MLYASGGQTLYALDACWLEFEMKYEKDTSKRNTIKSNVSCVFFHAKSVSDCIDPRQHFRALERGRLSITLLHGSFHGLFSVYFFSGSIIEKPTANLAELISLRSKRIEFVL